MQSRVVAVIVTRNRRQLLEECLHALTAQTVHVDKMVIVDNASTDDTREFLDNYPGNVLDVVRLESNVGGSGGFSTGIRRGIRYSPEFLWLMDDDTIPTLTSLESLLVGIQQAESEHSGKIGFASSRVLWNDGSMHIMNLPPERDLFTSSPLKELPSEIRLIDRCSFVSVLIRNSAVLEVGLPYKEYFIWGDDMEYTLRISRNGYSGAYIPSSIVFHKTLRNKGASVYRDDRSNAWRYFYSSRNTIHFFRLYSPSPYYWVRFLIEFSTRQIGKALLRRSDRRIFLDAVIKGTLAGLNFHPEREYIKQIK